jgi:putative tryptophan/tyrosine transport system substrate-binding protein
MTPKPERQMASYIGRRKFLATLGGAAMWPLAASAQPSGRTFRIGFLSSYTEQAGKDLVGCFQRGLAELGWIEGRNISIEHRWAQGRAERYPVLAAELARLDLDLIASNSTPAAQALQRATRDIPVVFMSVSDPVASGIVKSLARPEGNITGVSNFLPATSAKLLELLKSVAPDTSRVIVLRDPDNAGKWLEARELQDGGPVLSLAVEIVDVRNAEEIERAFAATRKGPTAVVTLVDGVTLSNHKRIVELATRHRLPAIYQVRAFVDAGGLMSYGLNFCRHFRRGAMYVDRILKGAKPADLPVELPTTFELIINRKAADAIGLAMSESFLMRADEVIE